MAELRSMLAALSSLTLSSVALAAGPADVAQEEPTLAFASPKAPVDAPVTLDGLAKQEELRPGTLDLAYSYGTDAERVTLYVFRATNPNAALWFERADTVLDMTFKPRGLGEGMPVEKITSPGAPEPNGLMRVYPIKGTYKSTALAIVDINGWLVKVRSSSMSLDTAGQQARMSNVISALKANVPVAKPHKLLLPEACPRERATMSLQELIAGEVIRRPKREDVVMASLSLVSHMGEIAGGTNSLAAAPETYCRANLNEPSPFAVLYRPKDSARSDWTVLFADSGRAVASLPTIVLPDSKTEARAMLVADQLDKSAIILLLKGAADPDAAWQTGGQAIVNGSNGMAVFHYDSKTMTLPSK